jgi:hypothetical protein
MRYFGTKRSAPADEDRVALDRLSAIASRYRAEPCSEAELPLDFPEAEAETKPEPDARP